MIFLNVYVVLLLINSDQWETVQNQLTEKMVDKKLVAQ